MKNSKKIIIYLSIIMLITILFVNNVFALSVNIYSYTEIPSDIGEIIENPTIVDDEIVKIYIVLRIYHVTDSTPFNINYTYRTTTSSQSGYCYNRDIVLNSFSLHDAYGFIFMPDVIAYNNPNIYDTTLYIPVYMRNGCINGIDTLPEGMSYYLVESTSDTNDVASEAFNLGFNIGYNDGYDAGFIDSAGYQQDLNLVEHCEQLLGTFVGEEYAHYITPLCLALVVILIYFLFIRWLLALVKSKNVTRVADIIVCTACIIMLVIMYAPMLDLTIHQAQTVYQITADTVVGG